MKVKTMKPMTALRILSLSALLISSAWSAEKPKPLNILWIVTDDHRADSIEAWNRAMTGRDESELGYVLSPRAYLRSREFAFSMRVREQNKKTGEKLGPKPGEGVKWGLEAPRDDVEMALFDLRSDPREKRNVANEPRYAKLADWFRDKLGRIVLGDGRVECDWAKNEYVISNFANGAHDRKPDIPSELIPAHGSVGKTSETKTPNSEPTALAAGDGSSKPTEEPAASAVGSPRRRSASRPNVLLIAVDDLNDWVGYLGGHPQTKTPNLDRLAAQSMVFENAQCPGVACNPSRAALLSGIAPYRSKMYSNHVEMRTSPLLKDAVMLPRYFSDHGYTSLARGKIFHNATGPGADPQSWDILSDQKKESIPVPPNQRTDMTPFKDIKIDNKLLFVQKPVIGWKSTMQPKEQTTDYQNAMWAAQWLTDTAEKKTPVPFFMACGIFRPHLPWTVPAEYYARFDLKTTKLPPINEDDYADIRGGEPSEEYAFAKKHNLREEVVWAYLANIAYADDCIGVLLDALEESPYADNTIVVLWSDHGWHVGEKLRYKKSTLWEETARMPLLINVPGLKPGRTKRPVSLIDLYPTLIELAGLPEKEGLSGRSIVPVLKDPEIVWNYPATTSSPSGHSLRTERWRYIVKRNGAEELYDHDNDPNEWTNLASNPEFDAVKKQLRRFLPKEKAKPIPKTRKTVQ